MATRISIHVFIFNLKFTDLHIHHLLNYLKDTLASYVNTVIVNLIIHGIQQFQCFVAM